MSKLTGDQPAVEETAKQEEAKLVVPAEKKRSQLSRKHQNLRRRRQPLNKNKYMCAEVVELVDTLS